MKGTNAKNTKRRPRLSYVKAEDIEFVQRKLTLSRELDKFLTDFAVKEGFGSEVQAVYQILREKKSQFEAASA